MFILSSTPGVDVRMSSMMSLMMSVMMSVVMMSVMMSVWHCWAGACAPSKEWSHPCDTAGQCSVPSH